MVNTGLHHHPPLKPQIRKITSSDVCLLSDPGVLHCEWGLPSWSKIDCSTLIIWDPRYLSYVCCCPLPKSSGPVTSCDVCLHSNEKEKLYQKLRNSRHYESLLLNKCTLQARESIIMESILKIISQHWMRKLESLNSPIAKQKIEAIIENLLKNKSPGLDGFMDEFY